VIATDCPTGPREILEDGRYGPLTPVGDVDALTNAIGETLAAPLSRTLLQARGEEFSVDHATERFLALFDRLMDRGTTAGAADELGGALVAGAEAVG
jgi:glycosyltransferase involved in cell wall biosynthesis